MNLIITVYSCLVLFINSNCGYSMEDNTINEINNNFDKNIQKVLDQEIPKIVKIEEEINKEFVEYIEYEWFKQLQAMISILKKLKHEQTEMLLGYDQDPDHFKLYRKPTDVLPVHIKDLALLPINLYKNGITLNTKQRNIISKLQDSIVVILQSFTEVKKSDTPQKVDIWGIVGSLGSQGQALSFSEDE